MKNYLKPGRMVTLTATADVESGHVVQEGDFIGVASTTAATGEKYEAALVGVYNMENPDSVAVTQGADVNFDLAAQKIVASGGIVAGKAHEVPGGALDVPVMLPLGPGKAMGY